MTNKKEKTIYYIATGLMTALMCVSAGMYLFNNQVAVDAFIKYGYPLYIIYPLAVAKILGLLAIWTKKSQFLKELAYAGFFFNGILALFAHIMVGEALSEYIHACLFLVFVITSYCYDRKVFGRSVQM